MSRIIHFEIPADDPQKCLDFYSGVFGWEFTQWGEEPYWLAKTGPEEVQGINGAIARRREPGQPVINTLDTQDVDATARSVEAHGGTVVVPKMAVPSVGWLIYFKDPEGNMHGAMQADPEAR